jgi:RNA polymerase sigma-70 factor (sigma-E family)
MLTGSREAGEDLVQTALVSTLASWSKVEKQEDPFAYVRRAMVNANITLWRHWGSRIAYLEPDHNRSQRWDNVEHDVVLRTAIRSALVSLPIRQRTVLVLRYFCDLDSAEIAEMMGTSPGTVKSQASRAIAKLRESLGDEAIKAGPSEVANGR